ncbi:hypothetical protein L3X38_017881 [Prunus dulcis]|uniref:Uncharacterized protein n=1 Tax=Prunus dulcis TaxID=3755 RepID=A0AAD4W9Q6_PRUDU|nr:hypothetical protein L3X38_017870 [Prunus dulcis]KAI5338610.1 hypothetical protein L3X38_017881 [Prunus dulcis]
MWPLPHYDFAIRPSQVGSPSNAILASSNPKSGLVALQKSNLLVILLVVHPKHEKDHKFISGASRHGIHRATGKDLEAKQACKLLGLHVPRSRMAQYSEDLVFLASQISLCPSKAITLEIPNHQPQTGGRSFYCLHSSFVGPGLS